MTKKSNTSSRNSGLILLVVVGGLMLCLLIGAIMNQSDGFKQPMKISNKKASVNPKLAAIKKPRNTMEILKKPPRLRRDMKDLADVNLGLSESEVDNYLLNIAKRRLERERPEWVDAEPIIQHKDSAAFTPAEGEWTEGAGGLSQIRDRVVIAGNSRTTLNITTLGPSFTENIRNPTATVRLPSGHTRFGQGCQFKWNDAEGVSRVVFVVPMTKRSGGISLGIYSIQNTLVPIGQPISLTTIGFAGWITQDPISMNLFMSVNLRDIISHETEFLSIYDLRPKQDRTGMSFEIAKVDECRIPNSGLNAVTGGFISDNGILYMSENADDNSGFSAFEFLYDPYIVSYVWRKKKHYRVRKPSESIFGGDSQDIVGFTNLLDMFGNYQRRLFGVLHRNQDIGQDNLSWTSVEGLM